MSSSSCSDQHTDTTPVQSHPRRLQVPSRKSDQGLEDYTLGADTKMPLVVTTPSARLPTGMSTLSFVGSQAAKIHRENVFFYLS